MVMRKRGFQAPGVDAPVGDPTGESETGNGIGRRLRIKGRGANSNRASRFLAVHSVSESDGWAAPDDEGEAMLAPALITELFPDKTRRLITYNRSPDIPFDRSINPYKGCEHGCVYCFARPTHAYLDLSPGLDFETRIFYKTRVREVLLAELGKPGYQCRSIAMGTNTDPYQPAEKRQRVTRKILEVLLEHRHPLTIVTKGQLILRDIDLLAELARHRLVSVAVSLTTLDSELKTRLEPRASGPSVRLRVLRRLAEAGIPTAVMVAPIIPFLNDEEMEDMVAAAAAAGVKRANYILLRLPLEVRGLFEDWLAEHYPLRAERVMKAIRESRGGKAYDAAWGRRMRGQGVFADLIARRFAVAVKRHGLNTGDHSELRTDLFMPPGQQQLDLY
jgi:DNA repair photolyase